MEIDLNEQMVELQKAIESLSKVLLESSAEVQDLEVRSNLEAMVRQMNVTAAEFASSYGDIEKETDQMIAAALKNCEEATAISNQAMAQSQQMIQESEARSPAAKKPLSIEPEPGGRLREEILARYGLELPSKSPISDDASIGWGTWMEGSKDSRFSARRHVAQPHSAGGQPAPTNDRSSPLGPDSGWTPFFDPSEESAKPSSDSSNKPDMGWSTWMDRTKDSGSDEGAPPENGGS